MFKKFLVVALLLTCLFAAVACSAEGIPRRPRAGGFTDEKKCDDQCNAFITAARQEIFDKIESELKMKIDDISQVEKYRTQVVAGLNARIQFTGFYQGNKIADFEATIFRSLAKTYEVLAVKVVESAAQAGADAGVADLTD